MGASGMACGSASVPHIWPLRRCWRCKVPHWKVLDDVTELRGLLRLAHEQLDYCIATLAVFGLAGQLGSQLKNALTLVMRSSLEIHELGVSVAGKIDMQVAEIAGMIER
eukprot:scaffold151375_cov36-Tisochrysis_lutea.AAC.1